MKNKHGIKEMMSRYLKEGGAGWRKVEDENTDPATLRLRNKNEEETKRRLLGPSRKKKTEEKPEPENAWTEYEGPSLEEQADYIARFLENTVVEGKYRGTLTPEQVDAMTAREKREYEQMLKDNSAAVANTPWSKANKKKDEEKPENSSTEYAGPSLSEQAEYIARFLEEGRLRTAVLTGLTAAAVGGGLGPKMFPGGNDDIAKGTPPARTAPATPGKASKTPKPRPSTKPRVTKPNLPTKKPAAKTPKDKPESNVIPGEDGSNTPIPIRTGGTTRMDHIPGDPVGPGGRRFNSRNSSKHSTARKHSYTQRLPIRVRNRRGNR